MGRANRNRTEMEKFEVIKGLWDALNGRRFDDILRYKQQLQRSKKFMALVAAIDDNKHKKFQFDFTKDNDITIGTKEKGISKNSMMLKSLAIVKSRQEQGSL